MIERNILRESKGWSSSRIPYLGTILFGGVHAASSFYWGLGGEWLLETIGQGAVDLRQEAPWWLFVMLILIGIAKLVCVIMPLANSKGLLPKPRLWRFLSWLGAVGLILYGGAYSTLSHLSLAGQFGDVDDRQGMIGHAYIWDPLFVAWGVCLAIALWLDRASTRGQ